MVANRWHWIIALATSALITSAHANLRAPVWEDRGASQALKPANEDLVVEYENLIFDLGSPYSGSLWDVRRQSKSANIEAEYAVQSPHEFTYTFEFIMPEPNTASVSVNGNAIVADAPIQLPRDEKKPNEFDLWKIAFTAKLLQGQNNIRVSYRQPLSRKETLHGYFITSKWQSFVDYELWPLKEWKLAPDFKINIFSSVDDDTPFPKRLFTSRHTVKALALLPEKWSPAHWPELEISGSQIERKNKKIKLRLVLGPDFPDHLRMISTEHMKVDFPPYVPK